MNWENIRYFKPDEFACPHCGKVHIDPELVEKLDEIRYIYGKPITISSGYRCPEYNAKISTTGFAGPHTTGKAVDIPCYGEDALLLLTLALDHGFTGIGVKQKGDHKKRFLHLDICTRADGLPRPMIWSY